MPRYGPDTIPVFGVYAYLAAPTVTTTTLAATWYPVSGPFTNPLLAFFTLGVNQIISDCPMTQWCKIAYTATFHSDTNNTALSGGVLINGGLAVGSLSQFYLKSAADDGVLAAVFGAQINYGDTIQLVIQSDQAGAQLTADAYSTTLTRW